MKRKGSNQYQIKWGLRADTWASIWFILLVVTWGIWLVQPKIVSPCPDYGCTPKFAMTVRAEGKSPTTPEEIVRNAKHGDLIMHIWEKESTFGRNKNPQALHNLCRAQGKSNEFGYGGMKMKICFDTFQDAVNKVDAWLDQRDNEALCYYNLGIKTGSCEYVK